MKTYDQLKKDHPDAIVLKRCGYFYIAYDEDARKLCDTCGNIPSKTRSGRFAAGFPHNTLDTYLPKLIRAGHRVAICEDINN